MLDKKGFTLVELLGVFVILGVIALVTLPYVSGMLKNTKDSEYEKFKENVFLATEAYIEANSDDYLELKTNGGITFVSFKELVDNGFLSSKLINPNTDQKIDLAYSVKVIKNSEGFSYEILNKNYSLSGYVKDDLILHYDGYKAPYTLGGKSYWKDLSGNNNNGLLVNTNNTIVHKTNGYEFTNNADYIESINNLSISGDPNFTIEVVYKSYGYQSNQIQNGILWFGNTEAIIGQSVTLGLNTNRAYFTVMNLNVGQEINTLDGNIYSLVVTKNSGTFNTTNAKICINNDCNNNTLSAAESSVNIKESKIQLGRAWQWNNQNRTLNGIIYSVRIYNRVLTQTEVNQNYQLDKLRFGI